MGFGFGLGLGFVEVCQVGKQSARGAEQALVPPLLALDLRGRVLGLGC